MSTPLPEYWLRGPVPGISDLLQPVAHALLQAREELHQSLLDFDEALLWLQPAGKASVGFHLRHLTGVLDRLFTYARGNQLNNEQLAYLKLEAVPLNNENELAKLLRAFDSQVDAAIKQLENTPADELTEVRFVGRRQIPSTVIGLLVHAAEHSTRHLGQLLVTAAVLEAGYRPG